jgi:N-acetylmuramoyl-L-alanine amidase
MTRSHGLASLLVMLLGLVVCPRPVEARAPQSARERYETARVRETEARDQAEALRAPADDDEVARAARIVRRVVIQYEGLVRRFPTSGYSDNALFQAASLSQWLHARYGLEADRVAAVKYYTWLDREYPASPLRRESRAAAQALTALPARAERPSPTPMTRAAGTPTPAAPSRPTPPSPALTRTAEVLPTSLRPERPAMLHAIERAVVDGRVRVTLTLDRETPFTHEVLAAPPRAFVDLAAATAAESLGEVALRYDTEAVRQVRVGRRADAVRVVMDLAEPAAVSVFTLYNPFRVVIDAEPSVAHGVATPLPMRAAEVLSPAPPTAALTSASMPGLTSVLAVPGTGAVPTAAPLPAVAAPPPDAVPAVLEATSPVEPPAPAGAVPVVPSANADGTYSLARQLGLGVSRIVIDPGHGGHDPGTLTSGSTEARLVLDVALRLEKLLEKDGFDVVLTRRTDVFVPLEERTAIANREGADLFLSIHANSGRDPAARGVEVYYLSFASNPDAEAVAARENATATGAMHNLPGIVRAIALNNKLDESRDFAQLVQRSLASRLAKMNLGLRNRGVKKAPFVVLIGANMPSVLAEIGFITNRQEASLIKTPAYRQRIAESLQAAVAQYQRALKRQGTVAAR